MPGVQHVGLPAKPADRAVGLTLDDVQLVDLPTAPRGLADEPAVGDAGAAR